MDDHDLIDTLHQSKNMSKEIKLRISASEENEKKITAACKKYLPMATRGSILFFVIDELSQLNCMYQFSLHWFMKLFTQSVRDIHKPHTRTPVTSFIKSATALQQSTAGLRTISTKNILHTGFNSFLQNMMTTLTENVYKVCHTH